MIDLSDRIAAGIVTYNPDISILEVNIISLKKQTDEIVIVDNFSENIEEIYQIGNKYQVLIISNNQNLGVATALNQIMSFSEEKLCSWCLTLDQDSLIPDDLVSKLSNYRNPDNGIVSCRHIDRNDVRTEKNSNSVEYVEWCISSGALSNVVAWRDIGKFDDYLFIDGVDLEFCLRLQEKNYKVLKVNNAVISHSVGDAKLFRFFHKNILVKNHSSFRKYYIARNLIVIAKKHGNTKTIFISYLKVFKQGLLVMFFEQQKLSKLSAIIKGVRDSKKCFYP
ncbi:glycosyltransferase family 2 protein [Streptococcus suis]|nr:glycosyltransferase family 2 protein [Streptococcus suis]QCO71381.1 Glycosyltransferase [Streptococcus suis]